VTAAAAAWPLPGGLAGLRAVIPSTHIDFWLHNLERSFSPPVITTMWAPHQTAATLVALVVLYLLAPRPENPARARAGWLLPALLIASLPALSSYIAIGLAIGVAGAALVEALANREAPWRTTVFTRWLTPGLLGFLLAVPVFPTILRGSSSGLVLHVSSAGSWSNGALFTWLFGPSQWVSLLDTPAVFLMEFGVIGLLAVGQMVRLHRQRVITPAQQLGAVVAVTIMALVTFVRPPIGVGNNLYARALLLSWFLLAPFAAMAATRIGRARWLQAAVLICAMGTGYAQLGYLLEGGLFWATPAESVAALRWVNAHTPRDAVVAIRPTDYENNFGYWLRRPLVLGSRRLALLFGADARHYDDTAARLEKAFSEADARAAHETFTALDADVVLVRIPAGATMGQDPPWAAAPCFDIAHRNRGWTIVLSDRAGCAANALR
jgi:hypothetical protein